MKPSRRKYVHYPPCRFVQATCCVKAAECAGPRSPNQSKTSLGLSLGFPEKYRQKCRFPSRSVRQRGVLTGVSQMRRRRACAFLPEPLPFSHTRSMAACIENGAARVGRFSRDSMGLG